MIMIMIMIMIIIIIIIIIIINRARLLSSSSCYICSGAKVSDLNETWMTTQNGKSISRKYCHYFFYFCNNRRLKTAL